MLPLNFLSFFLLLFNIYNIVLCDLERIVLDYDEEYSGLINNQKEYIFSFNQSDLTNPSRVTVTSLNATREYPVLIVTRQQRQILSWQIPLLVDTENGDMELSNTSRTLCPDEMAVSSDSEQIKLFNYKPIPIPVAQLTVSISTSCPQNIDFQLKIKPENEFIVKDNDNRNVFITPSAPMIYFYQFPPLDNFNNSLDIPDTVLLKVNSNDNICMVVSIQNSTCPVYDLEHDIRFEGYWETVTKRGGMNIPRSKFPNGFFIVFVSKSEDDDCHIERSFYRNENRNKKLTFSIRLGTTRREYLTAICATTSLIVLSFVFAWITICLFSRRLPLTLDAVDTILNDDDNITTTTTVIVQHRQDIIQTVTTPCSTIADNNDGEDDDDLLDLNDNSSIDETEYDTITEAYSERHIFRAKGLLFVSDLARKSPKILQKKSYLYLWHVITVAVFYGLPVVQLVFTYQRVLSDTGNQDLCYYNFLCAHPFGVLSDFNHVLSNAGYIALGILFIVLVYRRERWHGIDIMFDRQYGIPQHHGLFYAMGAALIMEGILSASYHVCPNHTNFQFDSSFMYVMAVLIMVKLYQNRHPDINATAYATFGVLAVAISLGMVGILAGNIYFWIGFTIAHLFICLLLTIQIYYMGCWKCDRGMFMRVYRTFVNDFRSGPLNAIKPVYKGRMALLVLGNACNWALAIMGLLHHDRDFATYLLAIFMANTLLYTIFYIVMKLLHKETIKWHATIFIVLATVAWITAMYFFVNKSISWALAPAESRQYNQPCKLFNFYDPHDIWHFLSATAMFLSFMILLTLDDDLTHTHRSKIHVF